MGRFPWYPVREREPIIFDERTDWGTIPLTIPIDRVNVDNPYRIRRHISYIGVFRYTGAEEAVWLQYGDDENTRQEIAEGIFWSWPFYRSDIRIVVTTAQPGETLKIVIGGAGAFAFLPSVTGAIKLRNIAGVTIDPALESKQDTIISLLQTEGSWDHGQITVSTAGTAVQGPNVTIGPGKELCVTYHPGNAGDIYIGNSSTSATSTDGIILNAVGQSIWLKISNVNLIWVNASVSGDKVMWFVET